MLLCCEEEEHGTFIGLEQDPRDCPLQKTTAPVIYLNSLKQTTFMFSAKAVVKEEQVFYNLEVLLLNVSAVATNHILSVFEQDAEPKLEPSCRVCL